MPARIEYKKGDKLGPYNIEFVKEINPKKRTNQKGYFRYAIFLCPQCKKEFTTYIHSVKSGNIKSCGCLRKGSPDKTIIGKKFGKLTVVKDSGKRNKNGNILWECKCECGNIINVRKYDLINKKTKSCGCYHREKMSIDITGQKFGKLTAIKQLEKSNLRGSALWLCECDCGRIIKKSYETLSRYKILSCGCTKSKGEMCIADILKNKNINFVQEYTFRNCINPKTNAKLRFDFYLPDYNCCIEYDGEQHFKESSMCSDTLEERQNRDNIKNQYCKDNIIKLIRIPYTEYDNIKKILTKELSEVMKNNG